MVARREQKGLLSLPTIPQLTFLEKGEKDQAKTMTGCSLIRAPSSAWTASSSYEPERGRVRE